MNCKKILIKYHNFLIGYAYVILDSSLKYNITYYLDLVLYYVIFKI